ncbi:MAG: dihydrolipoamide acetyltransferase family protein [Actinomycetota bacterium]
MARDFRLPDIGEGLTEAEIVRWLVGVGDEVESDQPIVEVETDKAVVEIPSPFAGVVVSLGGEEGDVIEVGEVLLTIGEPEEAPAEPEMEPTRPEPIVGTLSDEAETLAPSAPGEPAVPQSIKALPVVRKLARDNDIDLETIEGSGPGGRIMRQDVEAAIAAGGEPETFDEPVGAGHGVSEEAIDEEIRRQDVSSPRSEAVSPPSEALGGVSAEPTRGAPQPPQATEGATETREGERRPMSRLRRTIAANMAKSWAEIPHVTTFDDVDATRLLEVRRALGERHGTKIPIEALVVKAVIPALDEFPEFNSSLDGDDLVYHESKDIGIAVDTSEGLMVAVVRDADEKSVMDLASEVRRLGDGARDRSLAPEELSGQTFTVSNIGAVGGGHGTPIVPYGTVAILSVGAARPRPVVYEEDLAVAPVMPLSLSYDHRVIDGAVGRRFMALVLENLEEPALFLAR